MIDIDRRIRANLARHPDWLPWRHAKSLKCTSAEVCRVMNGASAEAAQDREPRVAPQIPSTGHSFAELRERYDHSLTIPRRIQEVVATHIVPGRWLHDWEMREIVGVSTARWRRYADQFGDYQTTIDGKVIWLDPALKSDVERMKAT